MIYFYVREIVDVFLGQILEYVLKEGCSNVHYGSKPRGENMYDVCVYIRSSVEGLRSEREQNHPVISSTGNSA